MNQSQTEMPLFAVAESDPNVPFLISVLQEHDWTTAKEITEIVFARTQVRWPDRKVRALANASKGQVCGGQKGYKLLLLMTAEEYTHWRNWMMSQADEMRSRVVDADKLFYGRKSAAG